MPKRLGSFAIERVLLVEGVSAAGKTTFIEQLASGKLSDGIWALLPHAALGFASTDFMLFDDWLELHETIATPGSRCAGLILDCDQLWLLQKNGPDYCRAVMAKIFEHADAVVVVRIRPPSHRLAQQLCYRMSGGRFRWPLMLRLASLRNRTRAWLEDWPARVEKIGWQQFRVAARKLAPLVPARVKTLDATARLRAAVDAKCAHGLPRSSDPLAEMLAAVESYRRAGGLDYVYAAWDTFLKEARRPDMQVDVVTLASARFRPGRYSWEIVHDRKP